MSKAAPGPVAPRACTTVPIDLGSRRYDILIGSGVLGDATSFDGLPGRQSIGMIVSNPTVAALYGASLADALQSRHTTVRRIELPDGEAHKNWASLDTIFDALLAAGADRQTVLYALGGGVVGDITGFAAACYMRGIGYVQVPTTLLAQVDSSVGGKTAINHPLGKNMIGAFHQPLRVVADLDTLASLPQRELVAGLAEVIKYGPVADVEFLAWLETHLDDLLARDPATLAHAVRRSCEIKALVVAQDERESGLRAILNFGHTFGHAIETGLGHGAWLHGEAVGCGMVMACDLAQRLGLVDAADAQRVVRLIQRAGLPLRGPDFGSARYLELMRHDKKAQAGAIRFVVLEGLGHAGLREAPDALVEQVVRAHTA